MTWIFGGNGDGSVSMATLPPFLRTLLVSDGTVTRSLEAYYLEPISVDKLSHEVVLANSAVDRLDIDAGHEIVVRSVNLRGTLSNVIRASAVSLIVPELLPEPMQSQLRAGSMGIGELLCDFGLETFREILEMGRSHSDVFRTYRIVLNRRPAVLITETFPLSAYESS